MSARCRSARAGITLGVAAIVFYMMFFWASGVVFMIKRRWGKKKVARFNRTMTSRIITVLGLAYSPLTQTILAVFSCRKINDKSYLYADLTRVCWGGQHGRYVAAGVFWAILFPLGIPGAHASQWRRRVVLLMGGCLFALHRL